MLLLLTAVFGCGERARSEPPADYLETCRETGAGSPDCTSAGLECADVGDDYGTVCTYVCDDDFDCPTEMEGRESTCEGGHCRLEVPE
jgi:hypothetical protein